MKHTHKETQEVEVVDDVVCDRCGDTLKCSAGNYNGINITGSGAYDSPHFPDMCIVHADVCEECASEWFKTFKTNPIKDYCDE